MLRRTMVINHARHGVLPLMLYEKNYTLYDPCDKSKIKDVPRARLSKTQAEQTKLKRKVSSTAVGPLQTPKG